MLNRRGLTLAELLVALVLAAIILGSATTSLLRQQHTHTVIRSAANADMQRRASIAVVAGQLSLLDVGDVSPGEASDTAIQIRAPIAVSIACGTGQGSTTLSPDADANHALGGASTEPAAGDSLWWRTDSVWTGAQIVDVSHVAASCLGVPATQSLHVSLGAPDTVPDGSALRVTRHTRYAIYKSGDGTWQLGVREWVPATHGFSSPQPVAGPFIQKLGSHRSGFRYFSAAGTELPLVTGSVDVSRIARVRISAYSLLAVQERGQDSVQVDSVDVALAYHHVP